MSRGKFFTKAIAVLLVAGITLDLADGSLKVARGVALGTYALVDQICDKTALANCARATATIAVRNYVIDAVDDSVRASPKTGGIVIANVLGNDTLNGTAATTATVQLSEVPPAIPGITLNVATALFRWPQKPPPACTV